MSGLQGIPIRVESDSRLQMERGNAIPILHEVRHALGRLIAAGQETSIDLNAIPFGPGAEERLIDLPGTGEGAATIEALGPTQVQETAIPGVWLLDYRNVEGERLALHLEIAAVPQILRTHSEDLDSSIAALDARLQLGQGDPRLRS
jgi:hydrogenase-1 operon protein HyaF